MGWLSGWSYRQKIGIDADTYIAGSLTDFTVSVNVPGSRTSFWTNVKSDGGDVRFTSSDGATLLKFEIESFDNTGDDAWYHVKVPTLSASADTDIYLYYGNAGATDGSDKENAWDSSYSAVYHLNGDKTEGAFDDSTSNNNDGTNTGTIDAAGRIDRARDFDGVDDKINCGRTTSLEMGAGEFAIELTLNATSNTGWRRPFSKGDAGAADGYASFIAPSDHGSIPNVMLFTINDTANGQTSVATTTEIAGGGTKHLLGVRDNAADLLRVYVDGVEEATTDITGWGSITNTGLDLTLGSIGSGEYYDGVIDEYTISKGTARSLDWAKARYRSGLGAWLSFSSQETETTPSGDGGRGIGRGIMRGTGRGL